MTSLLLGSVSRRLVRERRPRSRSSGSSTLRADYDLRRGRLWPLVLAATAAAPAAARRSHRALPRADSRMPAGATTHRQAGRSTLSGSDDAEEGGSGGRNQPPAGGGRSPMRAIVYHGAGKKDWETVPDPELADPTDAIIRVDAVTICGTDLHILRGDVPDRRGGPGPRARGGRHGRGDRVGGRHRPAGRPGAGLVHLGLRPLPLLPGGRVRAVPRRRRLDPRAPDRRRAGRVRPDPVRGHLHIPAARRR